MNHRLMNEVLLIVLSVFTFVFLKKTITHATASIGPTEFNVFDLLPDFNSNNSEDENNNQLEWEKGKKIKPADMKGAPPPNSPLKAESYTSLYYSGSYSNDTLYLTVNCLFNKSQSWIQPKYMQSHEIIHHEQIHFDLSELYARKFRKALSERNLNKNSFNEEISQLYTDIKNEVILKHKEFDKESRYAENYQAQLRWERQIARELNTLERFSKNEIAIALR